MDGFKYARNQYKPEYKARRKDKCIVQLGVKEFASSQLWKSAVAEFLGTMFYVLIGCGVMLSTSDWTVEIPKIAMGFGTAAIVSTQMTGHISGGHVNPVVTMATIISLDVSIIRGLMYMVFQCAGAIVGASILMALFSSGGSNQLGALALSPRVTHWQGVGVEFLLTFALVFCIQPMDGQSQTGHGLTYKSILTGFLVTGLHLFGVPLTGCGINPARALGPALLSRSWANHWVFWAGPMAAAITASVLYNYVFNRFGKHRKRGSVLDRIDCMEGSIVGRYRSQSAVPAEGHLFPRFIGGRRQSLWDRVYNGGAISTIYSPSLDYEIIPHFLSENNV